MDNALSRIHSAVVLLDADAPDFPEAALEVEKFFRKKGISLTLKAVHRRGFILPPREVDLFLSLLPEKNWHADLDARMSKASFKAGRRQLRGELFDLVVSTPEGSSFGQVAIFRRIIELMQQISV